MPPRPLTEHEISEVLASERIVRVAFSDREYPYVIPFGYVYLDSTLHGITAPGRKSQIAERNPRVGFQVDTSAQSGPWEWKSVTGEGRFEFVESEEERQKALAALESLIAHAPEWWQEEIRPLVQAGIVRVWRITPTRLGGIRYSRHEGGSS
jgi:nitroimidazol reductase NimA-like FMN-containing flavoprotein (pyridoxamine 5'-phosphate oxidase superfamily)